MRLRGRSTTTLLIAGVAVIAVLVATAVVVWHRSAEVRATIGWGGCGWEATKDLAPEIARRVECGELTVPRHYSDAAVGASNPVDDATVTIFLVRLRAVGPSKGSVVVNPGGPGGSGTQYLLGSAGDLARQPVADQFDIVSFDPRGVGWSTPEIRCRTDRERDAERAEDLGDRSPAGVARAEQVMRQTAMLCAERVGTDLLASVGTETVARDLDRIRAALGDERLTYLGYSYGTLLGVQYARLFGDRIRALAFDGVMDTALDPTDGAVSQAAGFQRNFDAFARDCVTWADCPLGSDANAALGAYQQLVRGLIATDLRTADGRRLTFDEADTATSNALYQKRWWPDLRAALRDLRLGDPAAMMALADHYEGRAGNGAYDNFADAFLAIRCADDRRVADQARLDRLDTELRRVAPYSDDGRGTGRGVGWPCEFWTTPGGSPPSTPRIPGALLSAMTNDPATPYAEAVTLAGATGGMLVSVQGDGHTASFAGNTCVDDILNRYLIDLTRPTESPTC